MKAPFAIFFIICTSIVVEGFLPPNIATATTTVLHSDKFNRDLEERSRQRAAGKGGGYGVGGAVLGGLLFGPFGMLFGSQIGAGLGAQTELNKARQEELSRLGVSQDMSNKSAGIKLHRLHHEPTREREKSHNAHSNIDAGHQHTTRGLQN